LKLAIKENSTFNILIKTLSRRRPMKITNITSILVFTTLFVACGSAEDEIQNTTNPTSAEVDDVHDTHNQQQFLFWGFLRRLFRGADDATNAAGDAARTAAKTDDRLKDAKRFNAPHPGSAARKAPPASVVPESFDVNGNKRSLEALNKQPGVKSNVIKALNGDQSLQLAVIKENIAAVNESLDEVKRKARLASTKQQPLFNLIEKRLHQYLENLNAERAKILGEDPATLAQKLSQQGKITIPEIREELRKLKQSEDHSEVRNLAIKYQEKNGEVLEYSRTKIVPSESDPGKAYVYEYARKFDFVSNKFVSEPKKPVAVLYDDGGEQLLSFPVTGIGPDGRYQFAEPSRVQRPWQGKRIL